MLLPLSVFAALAVAVLGGPKRGKILCRRQVNGDDRAIQPATIWSREPNSNTHANDEVLALCDLVDIHDLIM